MHSWKQEQRANDYRHPVSYQTEKTQQGVTAKAHEHAMPRPMLADAVYRRTMLQDTADA